MVARSRSKDISFYKDVAGFIVLDNYTVPITNISYYYHSNDSSDPYVAIDLYSSVDTIVIRQKFLKDSKTMYDAITESIAEENTVYRVI